MKNSIFNNRIFISESSGLIAAYFVGNYHGEMLVQTCGDHVLAVRCTIKALREGYCGLEFHVLGDFLKMVLFDASEDAWENEGVVDLVFEITSTAAVDISSVCLCLFG